MGDRVAVLKDGYLQQVDTPQNLYDRPNNVFVAAFIGSPSMNLYESTLSIRDNFSTAEGVLSSIEVSGMRRFPSRERSVSTRTCWWSPEDVEGEVQ